MKNLISIKEARKKKGISVNELSRALNLSTSIVELLDEDLELPDKFKFYRQNYQRAIYNYLGYKVPHSNNFQDIPNDYSKILLTSFFLIFTLIILFFSSYNIYSKYNKKPKIEIFEEDEIYKEINKSLSKKNLVKINHQDFLDLLSVERRIEYSQKVAFYSNNLAPIYYKVKNIDKKTIEFGELLQLSKIEFNLNNDFLIDLSNIANIEKIIYQGVEIRLKNNYDFYLKNFNINKLEDLL